MQIPMKRYVLYTELINEAQTIQAAKESFHSFTVHHARGIWKGAEEETLLLEFILKDTADNAAWVRALADEIRHMNKQATVLITESTILAEFI